MNYLTKLKTLGEVKYFHLLNNNKTLNFEVTLKSKTKPDEVNFQLDSLTKAVDVVHMLIKRKLEIDTHSSIDVEYNHILSTTIQPSTFSLYWKILANFIDEHEVIGDVELDSLLKQLFYFLPENESINISGVDFDNLISNIFYITLLYNKIFSKDPIHYDNIFDVDNILLTIYHNHYSSDNDHWINYDNVHTYNFTSLTKELVNGWTLGHLDRLGEKNLSLSERRGYFNILKRLSPKDDLINSPFHKALRSYFLKQNMDYLEVVRSYDDIFEIITNEPNYNYDFYQFFEEKIGVMPIIIHDKSTKTLHVSLLNDTDNYKVIKVGDFSYTTDKLVSTHKDNFKFYDYLSYIPEVDNTRITGLTMSWIVNNRGEQIYILIKGVHNRQFIADMSFIEDEVIDTYSDVINNFKLHMVPYFIKSLHNPIELFYDVMDIDYQIKRINS